MEYIALAVICFIASFLGTATFLRFIAGKKKVETVVAEGTKIPFSGTSVKTGVWRSKESIKEDQGES